MNEKEYKREIVKLNRKVLDEIFDFRSRNPKKAGSLNQFFMSFESEESQDRMAEIMADFIRIRMYNNKNMYSLPSGEIGLLFRQYVNAFF